ncbi:hypothetical protein [Hydrogenimonas sp. SS33]|uniref:hypothetical protein n=1 Tax=Hydrogenimonas leucolamina TaxID=2954236 RepID=UPI00336BF5E7
MRRLDPSRTRMLTHLVSPHYPSQQILHLSDATTDIHETLFAFTREKGFEYDLKAVACDVEAFAALEENHEGFRLETLDLERRQYNKHGKKYDNIYVTLSPALLTEDLETMLKKFYRIMKNGAILAFVVEKEAGLTPLLTQKLEEGYFVAINPIDIFDDYDVVTCKKLHGWGAYQVGF